MTATLVRPSSVLLLPGWLNSEPAHWQSRWERLHGFHRVEQDDWSWPRRGDWMARLDEVILGMPESAVLVAHSLGCHLVSAWAAHSRYTPRVRAALLVAPPDTERRDMPPQLFNWRPIVREPLPFATLMVASDNDPFAELAATRAMARRWGSELVCIGARGHVNGESGLGDWPEGIELLHRVADRAMP